MRLEADGISFRYPRQPWLFRGFEFSMEEGEIVGLTGSSGVGKTTFARILAGYERPVEGEVYLNGKPLPRHGVHPIQLVFQHPEKAINPRWRLKQILAEAGLQGDDPLLALLGIETEWLNRWPNELSGGELQRFCVARALSSSPAFLIADEMTAMLDALTQSQIWQAVLSLSRERHFGILVISHDVELLNRVCGRVVDFVD